MEVNNENQPASPVSEKKIKKVFSFIWELVKIAVIAFVIVAPIRYFLFQPFIVSGASMVPNFESGDYLIIDEISYRFSSPQRGDVIIFSTDFIPGYKGQRFIKRIIGLPGETVNIADGQVKIIKDSQATILDEDYLPDDLKTYGNANVALKSDEYFVMGDNRNYSYDSRMWGVVNRKYIIGKALFRILPLASLSQITNPAY